MKNKWLLNLLLIFLLLFSIFLIKSNYAITSSSPNKSLKYGVTGTVSNASAQATGTKTTPSSTGSKLTCTSSITIDLKGNSSATNYGWSVFSDGKTVPKDRCSFSSSNSSVAYYSGYGIVGKLVGTARISISYQGKTTSMLVNVKNSIVATPKPTGDPTRTPTRVPTTPRITGDPTRTPTRVPTTPRITGDPTKTPTPTPHSHSWVKKNTKAATCTEPGEIVYECKYCGQAKTESSGSALGHDWGTEWVDDNVVGRYTHKCIRCGALGGGITYTKPTAVPKTTVTPRPTGYKATSSPKPTVHTHSIAYHYDSYSHEEYCQTCGITIWEGAHSFDSYSKCVCGYIKVVTTAMPTLTIKPRPTISPIAIIAGPYLPKKYNYTFDPEGSIQLRQGNSYRIQVYENNDSIDNFSIDISEANDYIILNGKTITANKNIYIKEHKDVTIYINYYNKNNRFNATKTILVTILQDYSLKITTKAPTRTPTKTPTKTPTYTPSKTPTRTPTKVPVTPTSPISTPCSHPSAYVKTKWESNGDERS